MTSALPRVTSTEGGVTADNAAADSNRSSTAPVNDATSTVVVPRPTNVDSAHRLCIYMGGASGFNKTHKVVGVAH